MKTTSRIPIATSPFVAEIDLGILAECADLVKDFALVVHAEIAQAGEKTIPLQLHVRQEPLTPARTATMFSL